MQNTNAEITVIVIALEIKIHLFLIVIYSFFEKPLIKKSPGIISPGESEFNGPDVDALSPIERLQVKSNIILH